MSAAPALRPAPSPAQAMPHSPDAERTILAAALVDSRALESAGDLAPGDFFSEGHRSIYHAMVRLTAKRAEVDLVTVKDELHRAGHLETAGGAAYLGGLLDGVPRISNVEHWARIVKRCALQRNIAAVATKLYAAALEEDAEPNELIERADTALLKIGQRCGETKGPLDNALLVKQALKNIDDRAQPETRGIVGYRTGLADLDNILQGIRPGRMGIIGARLGNGKSMLALNVADAICLQEPEKAVLFVSMEMDGVELTERRLASAAQVDLNTLWHASEKARDERWGKLGAAAPLLAASNLRIVEDAWTVAEIGQQARELRNREGLAAVFVDYAQLMRSPGKHERRYQEVAEISVNLRKLAKELDVPMVVIAQLSREADAKGGKHMPPQISHLAEADNLGRDCHWCVLIDPEPPPSDKNKGLAWLYVRKNRGGTKGKCCVLFKGNVSSFLDKPYEQEAEE